MARTEAGLSPTALDQVEIRGELPERARRPFGAAIDTVEPIAHVRRDFEIRNLRLADFEAPAGR